MKKVKKLFETPKRTVITIICIVLVLAALGTGTVFAARAIAESSAIGAENAQNFAFADAGIDPVSAEAISSKFDFEQGQFVYEVEFIADDTEYEYWIKASDGSVVKKEMEIITLKGETATVTAQITLDEAKEKALTDAGLTASDVTFTKEKLDLDDRISVYDIEFISENTEYEYEINANTGAIYSKSKETIAVQPTESATQAAKPTTENQQSSGKSQQSSSSQISLDKAKSKALSDAGLSSSDVTYTKAKFDYDDGVYVYDIEFYTSTYEYDYEINASTGAIRSKDMEARKTNKVNNTSNNSENSNAYIGVDKAKSIAVSHAGFSVSDVNFSKAKLEKDDGKMVYEVEFYKNGMEYEYKINATTGSIIEYDSERDD